jgi:hypothetical protein
MSNFAEAPASWNTRYIQPDGFVCQITLRGTDGADLLPKSNTAIKWLLENGCQPVGNGYQGNSKAKGNGEAETKICPIHNVPMKRYEKNGGAWWSHKAPDGSWCKGK